MRKLIAIILAVGLVGCSYITPMHIHIVCPPGTTGVLASGNNVGTGLIATATSALGAAKLLGRTNAATGSTGLDPTLTTIDYDTWPIFGAEQEKCLPADTTAGPVPVTVMNSPLVTQPSH